MEPWSKSVHPIGLLRARADADGTDAAVVRLALAEGTLDGSTFLKIISVLPSLSIHRHACRLIPHIPFW